MLKFKKNNKKIDNNNENNTNNLQNEILSFDFNNCNEQILDEKNTNSDQILDEKTNIGGKETKIDYFSKFEKNKNFIFSKFKKNENTTNNKINLNKSILFNNNNNNLNYNSGKLNNLNNLNNINDKIYILSFNSLNNINFEMDEEINDIMEESMKEFKIKKKNIQIVSDEFFKKNKRTKFIINNKIEIKMILDRKYNIIYCDPPFLFSNRNSKKFYGCCINKYPCLSFKELETMNVGNYTHKDAILLMWTPVPLIHKTIELGRKWGFNYVTFFLNWIKDSPCVGFYVRQHSEILLMFKKGHVFKLRKNKVPYLNNVLIAPAKEHSEKPSQVYKMIKDIFYQVPILEMFARCDKRSDIDVWGNEIHLFGFGNFKETERERIHKIQDANWSILKNSKKNQLFKIDNEGRILKNENHKIEDFFNKKNNN